MKNVSVKIENGAEGRQETFTRSVSTRATRIGANGNGALGRFHAGNGRPGLVIRMPKNFRRDAERDPRDAGATHEGEL